MSETTPNLALPYILSAQAQKHVTHNEALRHLDAIVQPGVISKDLTEPPPAPLNGDRYLVATDATGVWAGRDGSIAAYQDGAWAFHAPRHGWQVWLRDKARIEVFDGTEWIDPDLLIPPHAYTRNRTLEEQLDLSGESTVASTQIPARAIVFGVSVRVVESVTGATSFDVGIAGETNKFGGNLGTLVGDTNIGVIGPTAFYDPTSIHVTANGSAFTGGKLGLALHFVECGPPTR